MVLLSHFSSAHLSSPATQIELSTGASDYCHNMSAGQIPAFGNWEYANDLPITQYFESARQAGLLRRYSCSTDFDLYDFQKPPPRPKINGGVNKCRNREGAIKTNQAQRKPSNVERPARRMEDKSDSSVKVKIVNIVPPKPVDEDLYKIPPELLRISKKRKMLRFLTRCLVPNCLA